MLHEMRMMDPPVARPIAVRGALHPTFSPPRPACLAGAQAQAPTAAADQAPEVFSPSCSLPQAGTAAGAVDACGNRFEPSQPQPNTVGSCFLTGTVNTDGVSPGSLEDLASGFQPSLYSAPPLLQGNEVVLPAPGSVVAASLAPTDAGACVG